MNSRRIGDGQRAGGVAMSDAPVLLDDALHPIALLENASFGWILQHNDLCTAELRLPCEDAANDLCAKLPWVH